MLYCLAVAVFMGVFFGLAAKNAPESVAVKATDFKAGRIIDDEIFYDPNTMTVQEIQAHLDKYSASCDMWGEQAIGYGRKINGVAVNPNVTRREYARMMREAGRTDYHDAPYVCISKFYENPETHKTNFDTAGKVEEGMISAAQIIYDAAHAYNINPQVLLVMLKKESYVWGDTWPLKNEYNTVMGYACPDNAPCDSAYFGFYNQVMKAAWQLNYYKEHIYSYGYYPYMTNNIYYSPNYSCGTKAVYLENIATTSLYIYTPYTPNDAALANYPGEAYCGSYGNRNFFMYFSEWFGSTYSQDLGKKINERHKELGEAESILGKATTEKPNCSIGHMGACVQAYENGVIIYSPKTGAWENYGEIRKKFTDSGSVDGELGFPIGPVNDKIGSNGESVQAYENGVIISSPKTGTWINKGKIRNKYLSLGSVDSELGYPTSDEVEENGIVYQKFENGVISIYENGDIFAIYGKIYDRYSKISGKLDKPTSDISCDTEHNDVCIQSFENGVIIYSQKTGAWESYGDVLNKYSDLKSINGKLGLPTGGVKTSKDVSTQSYENGMIVSDKNGKSYYVFGDIYKKYSKDKEKYGNPTMDPNCNIGHNGACVQVFENDVIISSKTIGTYNNNGKIREKFVSLGSIDGILGFPISDVELLEDGTKKQTYENGFLYLSENDDVLLVSGDIYKKYTSVEGLGMPTANINTSLGGGAYVQGFSNGVIIASPKTGVWENYGEIRKKFVELGSVSGFLGYPIGPMNCDIGHENACVQAYENGVIIYSPETGAWEQYGGIRTNFVSLKSVDGVLGFPTGPVSDSAYVRTVKYQRFQNGILYYDWSNNKSWYVKSN